MIVTVPVISNHYVFIKDQKVVLGLVTSKDPELEDKNEIKERIKEAAQYVALDQLCLSLSVVFLLQKKEIS